MGNYCTHKYKVSNFTLLVKIQTFLNTLTDKAVYRRHETFISDVRLSAMSLGLLCASREGGTGGGGWVSALSLGSMAAFGLGLEKLLVRAGWAISLLLCTNGPRKQSSRLVGPPFLAVKRFSWSRRAMVGREP